VSHLTVYARATEAPPKGTIDQDGKDIRDLNFTSLGADVFTSGDVFDGSAAKAPWAPVGAFGLGLGSSQLDDVWIVLGWKGKAQE